MLRVNFELSFTGEFFFADWLFLYDVTFGAWTRRGVGLTSESIDVRIQQIKRDRN